MMKQWIWTKKSKIIKGGNDNLDKIIDKSKSFEEHFKEEKIRPYNFEIQPPKRSDLKDAIDLILDLNEKLN